MNAISKMIMHYKRTKREQKLASDPNNDRKFIVIKDSPYSWHMEWLDEYEASKKEAESHN
ncbi:MAG: hypothetical protein M1128_01510 [Candidatus Marsarchaeota archaeon]|nr:hypothetical protein [Candidatus Marsarchaeota archaeon]